jgi:hypothetical protein
MLTDAIPRDGMLERRKSEVEVEKDRNWPSQPASSPS